MRMPCDHGNYGECTHQYTWVCRIEHPPREHRLAEGCHVPKCPGGREATAADLVAELERRGAIKKAGAMPEGDTK